MQASLSDSLSVVYRFRLNGLFRQRPFDRRCAPLLVEVEDDSVPTSLRGSTPVSLGAGVLQLSLPVMVVVAAMVMMVAVMVPPMLVMAVVTVAMSMPIVMMMMMAMAMTVTTTMMMVPVAHLRHRAFDGAWLCRNGCSTGWHAHHAEYRTT
jgi:hypothetical protein